ncbi:testisin-like [Diaphorina citri]|uniref:Testisin-like n=1 Tax=Diaphorina citri TaxID=121845 RepID=A0A3Q0IQM7_DIACI|nr:testisin-like [Diaphorina citri]
MISGPIPRTPSHSKNLALTRQARYPTSYEAGINCVSFSPIIFLSGRRSNILQKVALSVVSNQVCQAWYQSEGKKINVKESQMCAGHEQGGKDACWADSGGPLMLLGAESTQVIGLVSTGIGVNFCVLRRCFR